MASRILAVHERIASWSRQLRPRLAALPVRVVDTRSALDLERALRGSVFPLMLIDVGVRPEAAMDVLHRALDVAPDALVLVIDPGPHEGLAGLARELGATHVISGPAPPPGVASLLSRWAGVAERRADASGWVGSAPEPPEPEPWNWLNPMLLAWATGVRTAGDS